MTIPLSGIQVGSQLFLEEGGESFGAIRGVGPGANKVTIYVENGGEFVIAADAIRSAHDGKVILERAKIDPALISAIAHAHDREEPGL